MSRHTSSAHSPAPSSFRYIAASDLDLIVGGAGKQDTVSADPYLPGGGYGGGGGDVDIAVGPPAAGAADGPGFTWPTDTVSPDTLETRGDAAAEAGDGAVPPMCGTIVPGGTADDGAWAEAFDPASEQPAAGTGGDTWTDTVDSGAGWEQAEPPMTLDGLDDILPYEATTLPDSASQADDVGGEQTDWSDILPYEVTELPVDGAVQAQGDTGDGDGGGCHAGGDGDGDGSGRGDGSGGHHGGGGGCHGDGDGDGDGGGDGRGGCDGDGDDGDVPTDAPVQVISGDMGDPVGDPLSWGNSVTQTPVSAPTYERPDAAADVNTFHQDLAPLQGHAADAARYHAELADVAAPQGHAATAASGGGDLLDWAFSPRGPVASELGGEAAQSIWGLFDRAASTLRR